MNQPHPQVPHLPSASLAGEGGAAATQDLALGTDRRSRGRLLGDLRDRGLLIFGLAGLHHLTRPQARLALLECALDQGLSCFDVAPAYGNGLAERALGLLSRTVPHRFRVHTKVGLPASIYPAWTDAVFPLPRGIDTLLGFHRRAYFRRDFSPEALRRGLEGSLVRLRKDHVEMLYLHEPIAPISPELMEQVAASMEAFRREGKIGDWGIAGPPRRWKNSAPLPAGTAIQCPAEAWFEEPSSVPLGTTTTWYGIQAFLRAGGDLQALLEEGRRRGVDSRLILATRRSNRIQGWFEEGGA